jgi:signal transduction histidine kinase
VAVARSSIQLMMLRPRAATEYAHGLEALFDDNLRVEDLVTRMLSLARLDEQGSVPLAPIDIALIGERTMLRLRNFAEAHQVELKGNIEEPVIVWMAEEGIQILVSNLVINAVQHSPSGAAVELTIEQQEKSAILRVCDYGAGISAGALPHVFERFFREDTSRSRETGGAGLGLAICKSIVEGAGGTIAIDSNPGEGTNVTVTLPCAEKNAFSVA